MARRVPHRQRLLLAATALAMAAVLAVPAAAQPSPDGLQRALAAGMGLHPSSGGRLEAGPAIRQFIAAGYVDRRPTRRMDYTDYRVLKRPFQFLGQRLLVIEEEYMTQYIGCCVSEGSGAILRLSGDRSELTAFAAANKCRVSVDQPDIRARLAELGLGREPGEFARLSCRERDING
ncbi:hypothetical protein BN1110_01399 [bacterium YEK0313]|nr:hypothetical protein BN1110_01399 [bacterium YEK0313]